MTPATPHGVLPTKLKAPPVRPGAVPRERLLECLDAALWQPVSLVSAPAGSGKSTLIAQWLETRGHAHAWLSLEPEDNQPLALLRGLLATLSSHVPELANHPPISGHGPLVELLAVWVIPPLAKRSEPLVLVLDDAHHIREPDLIEAVGWFIEHLPEPCHVVLISRKQPHLPLARLQVRGQITIIDGRALRFSLEESRSFYTDTMALTLTDEELAALESRTEGWAAAIQLSALNVKAGIPALELAKSARPGQALEQFLMEEVLALQPEPIRRFLLRTSILARLSVSACEAVAGGDAGAMLNRIDRENLFVIALDSDRHWWRYHHLFASLLLSALERSDEDIPALHRLACDWALGEGLVQEAFHHALHSGEVERIEQVVCTFGSSVLFLGGHDTLNRWFDAAPDGFVGRHPRAGVFALWARALARRHVELEHAKECIQHALTVRKDLPDAMRREILANLYAVQAFVLHLSPKTDEALRLVDLTLQHLDDPEHSLAVLVSFIRGTVLLGRRELFAALDALTRTVRGANRVGNRSLVVGALQHRMRIFCLMGRFNEADEVSQALLRGPDAEAQGFPVQVRGWAALWQGDFQLARDTVQKAISRYTYLYSNDDEASGRALLALALEMLGETEAAEVEVLRAADCVRGLGPKGGLLVGGIVGVHRNEPFRVRAVLKETPRNQCSSPTARFWHDWMKVWLQAREGAPHEALEETRRQIERAQRDGARVFAVIWRSLEASLLDALGLHKEAETVHAQVRRSDIGLASALRTPLPMVEMRKKGKMKGEPLTNRETEVLGLVARGMTNRGIADHLSVSMATVKTHIHHIFRKMDVGNRTQAVHRARAAGWIADA